MVSYKKLWHLLLDCDMKKKDSAELSGISPYTINKINRDGCYCGSYRKNMPNTKL